MPLEYFKDDGSVAVWRRVAERLPAFLEQFPASEGYRIEVTACGYLQATGLESIVKTGLENGVKPGELGLSLEMLSPQIVFTATLYDKDGNAVFNGQALRRVAELDDWATGETAARNRLMTAAGMGGEVLDDDEKRDMDAHGMKLKQPGEAEPIESGNEPPPQKEQSAPAGEKIPPQLMRQLQQQAKKKGVDVPKVETVEQAKQALKDLMNQDQAA